MRRFTLTIAAAATLLAIAPSGAMARHNHRQRGHRHARIVRFGADPGSTTSTSSTTSPSSTSSPSSSDTAGTVQSFSGGVLTIALNDGSTVQGTVTNDTEFECVASSQTQTTHDSGDGSGGDQSGSGGDQSGSGDSQSQGSGDQGSGDDQNEDQGGSSCSSANLTPGTVVREAQLRVSSAGSVWSKVELDT